jgi:hypothetical protein
MQCSTTSGWRPSFEVPTRTLGQRGVLPIPEIPDLFGVRTAAERWWETK